VERLSRATVATVVEGDTEVAGISERRGLRALPAAGASGGVVGASAVRRNPRLNARFDAGRGVNTFGEACSAYADDGGRRRHRGGVNKRTARSEGASSGSRVGYRGGGEDCAPEPSLERAVRRGWGGGKAESGYGGDGGRRRHRGGVNMQTARSEGASSGSRVGYCGGGEDCSPLA
ncbi:MAG: hypothetical protein ACO32I_07750, partial [Candidatus Limnocylindrus sp.]